MLVAFMRDNERGTYTFEDAPGMKWRRGWFCIHASEGCRNCYAESMNLWRGNGLKYVASNLPLVRFEFFGLDQPIRWARPRLIFPCSMTDLFADFYTDAQIDKVFAVMALTRQHTYQVLTKRAKRMREYMTNPEREACWMNAVAEVAQEFNLTKMRPPILAQSEPWLPLPNVWLGVSVEDQKNADERLPHLLQTPAARRWISAEPLLGPVDLSLYLASGFEEPPHDDIVDWVVVGGESGKRARPMHPQWVRGLRDACQVGDISFFFKQWGQWAECEQRGGVHAITMVGNRQRPTKIIYADGRSFDYNSNWDGSDDSVAMERFADKEETGNTLDGRKHEEWPKALEVAN
jgi:protein gp37